jgi:hypothetical protein
MRIHPCCVLTIAWPIEFHRNRRNAAIVPFHILPMRNHLGWRGFQFGSVTRCLIVAMKPVVDRRKILARCA